MSYIVTTGCIVYVTHYMSLITYYRYSWALVIYHTSDTVLILSYSKGCISKGLEEGGYLYSSIANVVSARASRREE